VSGSIAWPGTSSTRNRWAIVARTNAPSIRAKWLPTQERGPPPKG
jgi:hypothetical protein